MAKFRNISPLGALDVPAIGRIVNAGETFEVPTELVQHFEKQRATFKRATASRGTGKPAKTKGNKHDDAA